MWGQYNDLWRHKIRREVHALIGAIPTPRFFEMNKIKTGFLYKLLDRLLNIIQYLNLVELFKYVGKKISPPKSPIETKIEYTRVSVDIFIVAKWLFLIILWGFKVTNLVVVIIVWYLLIMNLYTYFYYHTWASKILIDQYFDTDRIKRRFIYLLLSILYSVFGFAYFYNYPYSSEFLWADGSPNFLHSLWFSVSNSLTGSYDQVKPITNLGYSISMIQLIIMFIFITIIISSSIPQTHSEKSEGKNGLQK